MSDASARGREPLGRSQRPVPPAKRVVDRAVRRVLSQKFALGLFEGATVDAGAASAAFDTVDDRALARRAATASLVLLTNDGTLPLDPARIRRVAVLGPAADDKRMLLGDYHYPAHVEGLVAAEAAPPPFGPNLDYVPMVTRWPASGALCPRRSSTISRVPR